MVANNMHACLLLVSLFLFIYIMIVAELDGLRAYKGTSLWYFSFTTVQNIFTVCSKEGLAQWGEKMADDLAVKTIMVFIAGPSTELAVITLITIGFAPLHHTLTNQR
jgi:hypothetical protein